MFKRLFQPRIIPKKRTATTRELIRREAAVGGQLFGAVPAGHSRQFFCLDKHSWVWHEQWTDERGQTRHLTTRYEVRPGGILKAQGDQPYHYVELDEARNLVEAIELYAQHIPRQVYGVGA
jgi:hypothetical protein